MTASLLLLSACLLAQDRKDAPPVLEMIAPKGAGFTASLPGRPGEQTFHVESGQGTVVTHLYLVDRGAMTYLASYDLYPDSARDDDPGSVLLGARDREIMTVRGKLVSSKEQTIGGRPAMVFEYEYQQPDGSTVLGRSRIAFDGRKLYRVVVVGPREEASGRLANAVLASLKLVEVK